MSSAQQSKRSELGWRGANQGEEVFYSWKCAFICMESLLMRNPRGHKELPTKHVRILVVTVTGRGPHQKYVYILYIYVYILFLYCLYIVRGTYQILRYDMFSASICISSCSRGAMGIAGQRRKPLLSRRMCENCLKPGSDSQNQSHYEMQNFLKPIHVVQKIWHYTQKRNKLQPKDLMCSVFSFPHNTSAWRNRHKPPQWCQVFMSAMAGVEILLDDS